MDAKTRKAYNPFAWNWAAVGEVIHEYSETFFVFLFIVNGLATFLILFDLIESVSKPFRQSVGALAFSFSAVALIMFINKGVKHQVYSRKGRK